MTAPPPPPDTAEPQLLDRWRAGDEAAAEEIVRRYGGDLLAVVRRRMSAALGRRLDAEDVVQSALRSFFVAARAGRFTADRGGDLWRLLSTITLNKLSKLARHHAAAKRAGGPDAGVDVGTIDLGGRPGELSPLEALAFVEQVERLVAALPPERRPILQLRLEGHDLETIAAAAGCSQRTVRRVLEDVRAALEREAREGEQ
jgi:RNA polymerase sigma-70 factor (ECF subfamily)